MSMTQPFLKLLKKGDTSKAQAAVSTAENWSSSNGLHLNADKCKELQIDFKTTKQSFDPLTVNRKKLPVVKNAKILGLTISSNLKWTDHINEVIKKLTNVFTSLFYSSVQKSVRKILQTSTVQLSGPSWNIVLRFSITQSHPFCLRILRWYKSVH